MTTTIQIDKTTKEKLDNLKTHPRETYNDVINQLTSNKINDAELMQEYDMESLLATIEVLSDPETMRNIADAEEDYEKNGLKNFISFDDMKKELGI